MTDNAKKGYKKRGRKPKNAKKVDKPPPKKRGRKPKGGKIIKNISDLNTNQIVKKPNVILHLKCATNDIHENSYRNCIFFCFREDWISFILIR